MINALNIDLINLRYPEFLTVLQNEIFELSMIMRICDYIFLILLCS